MSNTPSRTLHTLTTVGSVSVQPETIYGDELGKAKSEQLAQPNSDSLVCANNDSNNSQNRGTGPFQQLGQSEFRTQADIDLLRNAINRHARFPIPDHIRAEAATWLAEVASSKKYDGRARVNAVKALADLDRLNMEEESRASGGQKINVDITSGGQPLGADAAKLKAMTTEELEARLAEAKRLGGG